VFPRVSTNPVELQGPNPQSSKLAFSTTCSNPAAKLLKVAPSIRPVPKWHHHFRLVLILVPFFVDAGLLSSRLGARKVSS
jgi:hypothetical protein